MDMYQKREMRKKQKMDDNKKSLPSTSINWYPGHMAKTRKQIIEDTKMVDIIIEILDARIPLSSQNPDIQEVVKNKKKVIVLNKCDLAEEKQNERWVQYFKKQGIPAILTDSNSGKGIQACIKTIEEYMKPEMEKEKQKGRSGRKIKAMIIGIPNVGKSSFINRIANKTSAIVGNKPGVTKKKQWIRINDTIELLDTPGILWPKFENEETAMNLAFTGTIKGEVIEKTEIAYYLTKFLLEKYQDKFIDRYKFTEDEIQKYLQQDQPENQNIYDIFLEVGRKRGCVISGGNIDEEKTANILLDEFKNGIIGKITIEWVNNLD